MEFLYELFESLGMSPNVIEDMINLVKVLPALPFMFLMWAVIALFGWAGLLLGFDFDQMEPVAAGIRGFFAMIITFVQNIFG